MVRGYSLGFSFLVGPHLELLVTPKTLGRILLNGPSLRFKAALCGQDPLGLRVLCC